MSSKRMDLNKMCFFVLSGLSNPLGKELAIEMCSRFKAGSVALLIDAEEQNLPEIRKDIESLEHNIRVVCCTDYKLFPKTLSTVLSSHEDDDDDDGKMQFDLAFIIHNEGNAATHLLIEPENIDSWKIHVQQNLYTAITINQEFLKCRQLNGLTKLMVNISSSLWIQPLVFKSLLCSSKKARDMYFRSIASIEDENNKNIIVMNYGPGIFDTHKSIYDCNNNIVRIKYLVGDNKILNLPRVDPLQSTLKLINILQEISFISGHDVDYYDTYNL